MRDGGGLNNRGSEGDEMWLKFQVHFEGGADRFVNELDIGHERENQEWPAKICAFNCRK